MMLPKPPLHIHPRKKRQMWAWAILLAVPLAIPGLIGLGRIMLGLRGARAGDILPVLGLAFLGLAAGFLILRRLRLLRKLGREFTEVHAPITSRKEQVESGGPTGRVNYSYRLERPSGVRAQALEGSIRVALDDGGPLFADAQAQSLVVMASPTKARLFVALRHDGYPYLLSDSQAAYLRHKMVERGVALQFGRGLPHLSSVKKGLRILLAAEAEGKLPPRPASGRVDLLGLDPAEPVLSIQGLAREVVQAFGFQPGTLVVTLRDDLDAAGQVEYEPGQGFFIDVRRELLKRPLALEVTLAHEVAHVFLAVHGINDPDRFELEAQTDLAAALWGFGQQMIANHKNELRRLGGVMQTTGWERTVSGLGYLTPDEVAYAMVKLYDRRAMRKNLPKHARRALRLGGGLASAEKRLGILNESGLFTRWAYRLRKIWSGLGWIGGWASSARQQFEKGHVVFSCPRCTQRMRLPLGKKGTATCPSCRRELPFSS